MKRLLRAVALVAVGIVIGGAVAAYATTTTNPVTLCVKKGAVREAANEICTNQETKIQVASYADLAALAARQDVDDADDAALATRLSAAEATIADLQATKDAVSTVRYSAGVVGLPLTEGTWIDLPGSAVEVTIDAGTQASILGRWTGVVNQNGPPGVWAQVRIVVDTTPAEPSGVDADGAYPGNVYRERSLGPLPPGTYVVRVQLSTLQSCGGCTQLVNVSPYHFTVERHAA